MLTRLAYIHSLKITLTLKNLQQKYTSVLGNENHPNADGPAAKFEFKARYHPKFVEARLVPCAMAPKVEEELDRLIKTDAIEPVAYSDWAGPIVPVLKSDGRIRLCGDYKLAANQAIKPNFSRPVLTSNCDGDPKRNSMSAKGLAMSSPQPPKSKLLLLIIMRWQVYRLARLIGKVVRFQHKGTQ